MPQSVPAPETTFRFDAIGTARHDGVAHAVALFSPIHPTRSGRAGLAARSSAVLLVIVDRTAVTDVESNDDQLATLNVEQDAVVADSELPKAGQRTREALTAVLGVIEVDQAVELHQDAPSDLLVELA